jgi:UDP-galactopyranose mutase
MRRMSRLVPFRFDLICLSHLRWNFVFQRPQHLLTRCARERRCFYFEEPIYESGRPALKIQQSGLVKVATPHLPAGCTDADAVGFQRQLVDELMESHSVHDYVLWYYTPMALAFTEHLQPQAIAYDCMDELSAFANAPATLATHEEELLRRADVVFTGGHSLYEAKRHKHASVHAFPSSVDVAHFARARSITSEPPDQATIPRPRLGYFGVIDERLDASLLDGIAAARPDWQFVMVGPIVKIDPATLPQRPNIHYLGQKTYDELPSYISGWNVALLPFARNEATRYISPTKTPEYIAAGKPVVSTSIHDVVHPYEQQRLVRIADTVDGFANACAAAMDEDAVSRTARGDAFLGQTSWDQTWAGMRHLLEAAISPTTKPESPESVAGVV